MQSLRMAGHRRPGLPAMKRRKSSSVLCTSLVRRTSSRSSPGRCRIEIDLPGPTSTRTTERTKISLPTWIANGESASLASSSAGAAEVGAGRR